MSDETTKNSKIPYLAGIFAMTAVAFSPLIMKQFQGEDLYVDETCPSLIQQATAEELDDKRSATRTVESIIPIFVSPAPSF